ncbi:MAG: hypothetical protein J6S67_15780 [Methanobrevibacter sp.]|nr:hypothetical protein [Methanobrevibacter sp.]
MMEWNVKSGVNCPICGKELELMSGTWYYKHNLSVVTVECYNCDLVVYEYGSTHGFKGGDANSYWPLVNALLKRVGGKSND